MIRIMLDAPALPPPAVVAPAPREVSFGLVAGTAPVGTRRIVVHVGGRLAQRLHAVRRRHGGVHGIYVQDLRTGRGAAWNAGARFPAASTLKLAIAVTALRRLDGPPAPASRVSALLARMLIASDNEAANELEAWIGGSVFAGSVRVNETMRALGLHDSLMYGGYESPRRPAAAAATIPIRVDSQPAF